MLFLILVTAIGQGYAEDLRGNQEQEVSGTLLTEVWKLRF